VGVKRRCDEVDWGGGRYPPERTGWGKRSSYVVLFVLVSKADRVAVGRQLLVAPLQDPDAEAFVQLRPTGSASRKSCGRRCEGTLEEQGAEVEERLQFSRKSVYLSLPP